MIYEAGSAVARGSYVVDLDTRERLQRVLQVDTGTGEVVVAAYPVRLNADRTGVETETLRFDAVWPILDRGIPCAFHCHGRKP